MENTKEIITKLKQIKEEKGLSLNEIVAMVDDNGEYVSRSTVQRVFSEGSESVSFRYEESIRPIANALLDIENIEDTDSMDIQAMKVLLKYKIKKIEELEQQLDKEKIKYHEKLDKEREQSRKSIEFLKEQVSYKDKRMDLLLESIKEKDIRYDALLKHILECPFRKCEDKK